jgi:hypothetical protein
VASEKIAGILEKALDINSLSARNLIKPIILRITYIYIDRSLRIAYQAKKYDSRIVVPFLRELEGYSVTGVSEIRSRESNCWFYNQYILQEISKRILDISLDEDLEPFIEPKHIQKKLINKLFKPQRKYAFRRLIVKMQSIMYTLIRRIPPIKPIFNTLGFVGDEFWLTQKGFYGITC